MKPPFFIIGNPRSGTSLLRLMLNNHQKIVVPPECGFAVWFKNDFSEWNENSDRDKSWVDDFAEAISTAKKIETWDIDLEELRKFLYKRSPESYSEAVFLVYTFYGLYVNEYRPSMWGDKNNFHIRHIDDINSLFGSCKFIHIIRDGRDVACSYKNLNQKKIDSEYAPNLACKIDDIASEWMRNIMGIKDQFEEISSGRKYEIKYESLVSSPESELCKLCKFLNESYDQRMLDYHRKNRKKEQEPKEFLQWKKKTLDPPSDDRVGAFSNELNKNEKQEFERIAGDILEMYDYVDTN